MRFETLTPINITLALMGVLFYFLVSLTKARAKKRKEFNYKTFFSDNWLNAIVSIVSIFPLLIIAIDLVPEVNYLIAFSIGFLNSSLLRSVLVVASNLIVKKDLLSEEGSDEPVNEDHGNNPE